MPLPTDTGLDPTVAPHSMAPLSKQHPKVPVSQQKGKPDQTINQVSEAGRTGRCFPKCHRVANACARASIIKSPPAAVAVWSEVCRSEQGASTGSRQSSSIFTAVSIVFWCGRTVCLQNTYRQKFCLESSEVERLDKVILHCFYILSAVLRAS